MRRSGFLSLLTLSALAILTSTAASAAPAVDLGSLNQQDNWNVGIVRTQGATYCAMISQFDKETALAFASNPRGFGSIAIDFRENFFHPGTAYEVAMQTDDVKARKFIAHASSTHSVIVQTGLKNDFYNSIGDDGNLRIWLPGMSMAFAVHQFSGSFTALMDCAAKLLPPPQQGPKTAAMPVPPVEKAPLTAKIDPYADEQRAPPPPVEMTKHSAAAETDNAAAGENADLKRKLALAQAAQDDLKNKFEQLKQQKDALAAGLEAQDRNSKVLQAALDAKDHELSTVKAISAEDKKTLANLQTKFSGLNLDQTAVVERLQGMLTDKTAQYDTLQKQFTDMESLQRSATADAARAQGDLAQSRQRVAELQSQLTYAEHEKSDLMVRLDSQDRQGKSLFSKVKAELDESRQQASMLENQMMSVAMQKDNLAAQLDAQNRQNRILQAALDTKEKELSLMRISAMENSKGAVSSIEPAAGNRGSNFSGSKEAYMPAITPHAIERNAPSLPIKFRFRDPAPPSSKDDWQTVVVQ